MSNKDKGPEAMTTVATGVVEQRPKPRTMFRFDTIDDGFRVADIVAKSTLCPKDYRGRPGDIVVAWQLGAEVGLEPMQALAGIAVINGRASLWGDTFLAVAMSHPAFVSLEEMSFAEIKAKQGAVCTVTRRNRPPVQRTFSVADARQAQLWGKQGPWKQYPERMLQMRARGFALRDSFPDALIGMVSAEEAQDYRPPGGQQDGSLELTDGTHKFGFAPKPAQEPAPEPTGESPVYVRLIESILAATDEESLAACRPDGDLGEKDRELANRAWLSRRDAIQGVSRDKPAPKALPTPEATAQIMDELQREWMDKDVIDEKAKPSPLLPTGPAAHSEPNPWEKHLEPGSSAEVVDAVPGEAEEAPAEEGA